MSVNYAYVENETILEKHYVLPENWRHVSGLRLLANDLSTLKSLGWYPVTNVEISYDPGTQYISDYTYELQPDVVTATPVISNRPPEQIITFEQRKAEFMYRLREERNYKLSATDWTRLDDVNLTTEQKETWATYRQQLRDLPQTYESNNVIDINQVVWP